MNLQLGPWGGGNQWGHSLAAFLRRKGVEVSFDLSDPSLDLIVLTEPRSHLKSSAYSDRDIIRYLLRKNPRTIVVHVVNECDERKGTTGVNEMLIRANVCADHTVFVSTWLRDLFLRCRLRTSDPSVILNGANKEIFNARGHQRWDRSEKLRLVTHHWGANLLKGFDIYERLDRMLTASKFADKIEFTYIGNLPQSFRFAKARFVEAQSGVELTASIRSHHVYLTASQNEPAGMHHIEGAMCGLPLLYRESGGMPEYCSGFGVPFTTENFEQKLQEIIHTYDHWADRMEEYPHTAGRMGEQYYDQFVELLDRRDELIEQRTWRRKPAYLMKAFMPRLPNRARWPSRRVKRLIS